jgi:hypothetical protein
MRVAITLALVLLGVLLVAGAASAQTYSVILEADNEVPPTASTGAGHGTLLLDAGNFLTFDIEISGLVSPEIGAHIHGPAPVGEEAGVLFSLPIGNEKTGVVGPLTAQQVLDLNAGLMYVNIHTQAFDQGEIRGQILNTIGVEARTWGAVKGLYAPR